MKILQLLEFGYIFFLFSRKRDRKGSSQKNIHRRQISPSSTVVYSIKTVVPESTHYSREFIKIFKNSYEKFKNITNS